MLLQNELKGIQAACQKYDAELIAVTKTRSLNELEELLAAGQNTFGENRVQELLEKKDKLPNTIQWHLIGHLQTNKVKYIADFITMIHSVDSIKLAKEINKQAKKHHRIIDCLLQFHVAQEESKFGISPENKDAFVQTLMDLDLQHIKIRGIMGMASLTEDKQQVQQEFASLKNIHNSLKNNQFKNLDEFDTLSMGMSGDYEIALKEGSTMIRVGSKLFSKI